MKNNYTTKKGRVITVCFFQETADLFWGVYFVGKVPLSNNIKDALDMADNFIDNGSFSIPCCDDPGAHAPDCTCNGGTYKP